MKKSVTASAHGRVNLIGEHTDYNGGLVLPTLIPQTTTVTGFARDDQKAVVKSKNLGEINEYFLGGEKPRGQWIDYVQGLTREVRNLGLTLPGFEVEVGSAIPLGGGLSSSAAFCVAFLRFFRELAGLSLGDQKLPALCQKVENEFVGAHVGIMDPAVCAWGSPHHALFIDTRSLETRSIALPANAELVVVHSGVSHRNIGGGYSERRRQCEEAARSLRVNYLSEVRVDQLESVEKSLPSVLFRRVRHVVTENARVLECARALTEARLEKIGALFRLSHLSMRDDYEVSIPEIDFLVEAAQKQENVYGARLTGGGFGGSIVALCKKGQARNVGAEIISQYEKQFSFKAQILVPVPQSEVHQHTKENLA